MSTQKSTKSKPKKPSKDFPLFPHACGQWAKKVRGRFYYFGVWEDHQAALRQWLSVKDELLAGRTPVVWDPDVLTVAECLNLALAVKERKVTSGELTERSFDDYHQVAKMVTDVIDRARPAKHLRPHDFQKLRDHLAAGRSPVTLRNLIRRVKVLFNWCSKNGYIPSVELLWGTEFAQPSQRILRLEKEKNGPRLISANRIHQLINDASDQLTAMILLRINAGYGPADCCRMERRHLVDGWAVMSRGKTGKTRRAKLWPETGNAIEAILRDGDDLIFRTCYGNPWD
ncbi:MAG: hypothetical protein R3C03_02905 [Pirellulaceae bacterium]